MRNVDVTRWDAEPELWALAASGEAPSAAVLRTDFLGFWSSVSMETLAAMLMWTHSGWGLSEHFQQPPVDATAVHVLSLAVMHEVRASLAEGDERPLREVAIDAHLRATERLLGSSPYHPDLISAPKYCSDCLWQHLARSATGAPDPEALHWFASPSRQFGCRAHLEALDEIRGRLKVSTPKLRDSRREVVSLEVVSTFQKYAPFVIPGTVRLLLPAVIVTCLVEATLTSRAPESRDVPMTRPLQQRRGDEPLAVSMPVLNGSVRLVSAGVETPLVTPPPSNNVGTPPPPPPSDMTVSTPGAGKPTQPSAPIAPTVRTGTPTPVQKIAPPLPPPGGGGGRDAIHSPQEGIRSSSEGGPSYARLNGAHPAGAPPGGGTGSVNEMNELAHRLSVHLQGWGKPCKVGGQVFTVSANKRGLLIDGKQPQLKDIDAVRLALRECQR